MIGRADPGGSNNTSMQARWAPRPSGAASCASIGDDEAVKVESGETLRPGAVIELRILDVACGRESNPPAVAGSSSGPT
jgi:hypothetical protein